eukprot:8526123-Pyramimonas_sp.AAC.1
MARQARPRRDSEALDARARLQSVASVWDDFFLREGDALDVGALDQQGGDGKKEWKHSNQLRVTGHLRANVAPASNLQVVERPGVSKQRSPLPPSSCHQRTPWGWVQGSDQRPLALHAKVPSLASVPQRALERSVQ